MRCESDSTGEKRSGPAPMSGRGACSAIGKQRGSGRTNERVQHVPDRVDKRNFVGEELHKIQNDGNRKNCRVRKHV